MDGLIVTGYIYVARIYNTFSVIYIGYYSSHFYIIKINNAVNYVINLFNYSIEKSDDWKQNYKQYYNFHRLLFYFCFSERLHRKN